MGQDTGEWHQMRSLVLSDPHLLPGVPFFLFLGFLSPSHPLFQLHLHPYLKAFHDLSSFIYLPLSSKLCFLFANKVLGPMSTHPSPQIYPWGRYLQIFQGWFSFKDKH